MKLLDAEEKIGISTFFTSHKGIGGKLRAKPEDFFVSEISNYPPEKTDGKFTIADVTATNWETNLLVREISDRLHISRQRIGFAGTKDKRAKTTRLMSFYKIPIDRLSSVKIKDVKIENIYYSDHPVKIGNLVGNSFEIVIRNINEKTSIKNIRNIYSEIEKNNGFPNFFGIQRFGIIRPITHIVGKYIVQGDFEKAVMSYIANPFIEEGEEIYELRKDLQKTYDFSKALKYYPNHLNFEKAILNKLVKDSQDFIGAIKELPKNLLTMFINAYQSYLFNKILSQRIKRKLPLNEAVVGDVVLPIRRGVLDQEGITVKDSNIDKINFQVSKGKAVVSSILFGSDSKFSEGDMGIIEQTALDAEKIDHQDFIIPDIPYISSSGSRRSLLGFVKNFDFKQFINDFNNNNYCLLLKFDLQKGCYATSLLREFMKTDDIRNY
ncbi:MAG: tRNA pseudouridine(13) synthase TruD [Thermoplasmatales archaeon]|nr:MAG: tRNA pseudouridine(13) synthase TruD [Thermoplasmatales archaeon]